MIINEKTQKIFKEKKPSQRFQRGADVWVFSLEGFLFGSSALIDQPFGHNAKLFSIDQSLSVGIVGRGHEQRVDLIFAI
jgi:hypothetical protein